MMTFQRHPLLALPAFAVWLAACSPGSPGEQGGAEGDGEAGVRGNSDASVVDSPDAFVVDSQSDAAPDATSEIAQAGLTAPMLAVGNEFTCLLRSNGTVKCWGIGFAIDISGKGMATNEMGDQLAALDLGGSKATALVAGHMHACVLLKGGAVKCWESQDAKKATSMGSNLKPVDLGTDVKATALAAAYDHTCALLEGGAVKCWTKADSKDPSKMGNKLTALDLRGQKATALAGGTGNSHTCARMEDGKAICWGRQNHSGQLGSTATGTPWLVSTGLNGGDSLQPTAPLSFALALGGFEHRINAAHSQEFTCSLFENGVSCVGKVNNVAHVLLPASQPIGKKKVLGLAAGSSKVYAWFEGGDPKEVVEWDTSKGGSRPNFQPFPLQEASPSAPIRQIVVNGNHACALYETADENRSVACWGNNWWGELGFANTGGKQEYTPQEAEFVKVTGR